ncbi:DNA/RNA non-specific endonuclease [Spirosoma linguale]|uniref:Type VII secretion system protein EssD-like domain-containing protein n=1 Tax=Spirosoma linguale (strain ATCC 33905 / DSM 74 / LMG 10896 / Claus 1) TaxID=504472 RepID=D2QLJ8_SPILD|nr:hypothetical protein Slin_4306 [Spirosoma linguale DSM 74]
MGSERLAQRLLNNSVEYIEVSANATKKVEQALIKNADDEIQSITEEVEDATGKKTTIKICGFCLAGQTPVFGSGQSLAEMAASQPVQTLERDGSVGWRKLLGKVADRVEGLVRIWVRGEAVSSAPEHDFLTQTGKRPARSLVSGMLVYSLLTGGWLPVDSVSYAATPTQVEGLVLGDVVGYGVGRWGLVVSDSRRCPKRVRTTNEALDQLENVLGNRYNELVDLLDQLPNRKYTLQKVDGQLKLIDEGGTVWLDEISATQFKARGGTNPWNQFLDVTPPLMKNFEYVVDNNFIYKTDDAGRVSKITVEDLQTNQARPRNTYQQQKAKDIKDGKTTDSIDPTDDGGHMVASQFYGPSEQINYFPQNAVQNRAGGDWYIMEQELKQLRINNPNAVIKVEITPVFDDGIIKRPSDFDVRVTVTENGIPVTITKPRYNISNL